MTLAATLRRSSYKRATIITIGFTLAATTGACADKRGGPISYNVPNFTAPDVDSVPVISANQKIGPLDTIEVKVFQVADLSGEHQVDLNGFINMPLIGKVVAQGKSSEELGAHIAARLGEKYLRSPNVNVLMRTAASKTITVDGAVGVPGVFPIQGSTSLIKAIALARGTGEGANPRRVIVFRNIKGQRTAAAFDLTSIRRAESPDPEIFGNDIIVVDGNTSRSAYRELLGALPLVGLLNTFRPF